jgi:hypothetical protein
MHLYIQIKLLRDEKSPSIYSKCLNLRYLLVAYYVLYLRVFLCSSNQFHSFI